MITNATTIGELAAELAELKASVRIASRRNTFAVQIEWARGSATFNNAALGPALDGALALLRMQVPEPMEPAVADPNGARVGRAPRPDPTGTRVGRAPEPSHCFACGCGENEGDEFVVPCPCCGAQQACALPNNHDGDHLKEGAYTIEHTIKHSAREDT